MVDVPAINTNPLVVMLLDQSERLALDITDATGAPAAPARLEVRIKNLANQTLYVDRYGGYLLKGTITLTTGTPYVVGAGTAFTEEVTVGDSFNVAGSLTNYVVQSVDSDVRLTLTANADASLSGVGATKISRIVNPVVGRYYMDWTATRPETLLFLWTAEDLSGDLTNIAQTAEVITPTVLTFLPGFRLLIDKSAKLVDYNEDVFLGYTDEQLIQYLQQGLSIINSYEPYPTFRSLDQFPREHIHILNESALLAGVMSQSLFAIDTDMPFSDQGNTITIEHASKLTGMLNTLSQRLDKMIPVFKKRFVRSGGLHLSAGPNYRLAQLLAAAPSGALFRNLYFKP